MKALTFDTLGLLPVLLVAAAGGVFVTARAPAWVRALVAVVAVVVVAVLGGSAVIAVAEEGGFRYLGAGGFVGARLTADLAPQMWRPFVPLVLEPLTAPLLLAVVVVGAAGNIGLALGLGANGKGRITGAALGAGLLLEATVVLMLLVDHPAHLVGATALSGVVTALGLGLGGRAQGVVQFFGVQRAGDAALLVALLVLTASLSIGGDVGFTFDSLLAGAPALDPWHRLEHGAFTGFAHRTLWFIGGSGVVVGVASRAGWLCWPWLRDATADPETPAPLLGLAHGLGLQGAAAILLLRLHPIIALSPEVQDGLVVVGAATLLLAGLLALAGRDLLRLDAHLLAAFSGLMAICAGTQEVAGVALAGIFLMAAGLGLPWALAVVVERTGQRDPRALGGLEPLLPRTHSTRLLLTAGVALLPPFCGFAILVRALEACVRSERVNGAVVVVVVVGALLMGLAGWRVLHLVFTGKRAGEEAVTAPPLSSTLPAWIVAFVAPLLTLIAIPQGLLRLLPWALDYDPVLPSFVRPSLLESAPLRALFAAPQTQPPLAPSTFMWLLLGLGVLPWLLSVLLWRKGGRLNVGDNAVARWLARLAGQDSLVARSVQESVERLSRLLAVNLVPAVLSIVLQRVPAAFAAVTAFGLRLLQNGGAQQAFFLALVATAALVWLGGAG
ncbi:MAG: proton-conducting transporter membrane subunit [Deltaproteobacteria bacterium]|nr:proton-conducting transporter membrane subunit [Deltaproteobacteria bacterium]